MALADGVRRGAASHHADRKAKPDRIAVSKQLCGEAIGMAFWPPQGAMGSSDQIAMRASAALAPATAARLAMEPPDPVSGRAIRRGHDINILPTII